MKGNSQEKTVYILTKKITSHTNATDNKTLKYQWH